MTSQSTASNHTLHFSARALRPLCARAFYTEVFPETIPATEWMVKPPILDAALPVVAVTRTGEESGGAEIPAEEEEEEEDDAASSASL